MIKSRYMMYLLLLAAWLTLVFGLYLVVVAVNFKYIFIGVSAVVLGLSLGLLGLIFFVNILKVIINDD